MLVTPSIPAVQNQVVKESFKENIIEFIENEDYKKLKGLLVQLLDDVEEPSDRILQLRVLLDELDKYSDDKKESKLINSILHLLFSVIGVALIYYGSMIIYAVYVYDEDDVSHLIDGLFFVLLGFIFLYYL
jgi:hypothetical protein